MLVRAISAHTQPGTGQYRAEGEKFEHSGKLYKHVEKAKGQDPEPEADGGEISQGQQ